MKRNILRSIQSLFLILIFAAAVTGCAKEEAAPAPPRQLWYLGGAPILADFSVSGGPADSSAKPISITIYVPLNLVQDGFGAAILGTAPDGTQTNLLLEKTLEPGYYNIEPEEYEAYESLTLHLSYHWAGEMLSMRVIDLFSQEDLVPAYPST